MKGETVLHGILILIFSNYMYKMVSALIDTGPFYLGVKFFSRYLQLDPNKEFRTEEDDNKHLFDKDLVL